MGDGHGDDPALEGTSKNHGTHYDLFPHRQRPQPSRYLKYSRSTIPNYSRCNKPHEHAV